MDRVELEQLLGTRAPLTHSNGRSVMGWVVTRCSGRSVTGWVDWITLITVLSGGTLWGLVALGVINADPSWQMRTIYGLIGLSAIWQWARQRLW